MDAYLTFLWLFVGYAMWSLFPEWWPATRYFWRQGIGESSIAVLAALAVWPATNAFERQHNHRFLWHRWTAAAITPAIGLSCRAPFVGRAGVY